MDPPKDNIRIKSIQKAEIEPGQAMKIKIQKFTTSGFNFVTSTAKKNSPQVIEGVVNEDCREIWIKNLTDKKVCIHKQQHIANLSEQVQVQPASLVDFKELGEIPNKDDSNDETFRENFSKKAKVKIQHLEHNIRDKVYEVLLKHFSVFDEGSCAVGEFPVPVSINPANKDISVKPEKRRAYNPNIWSKINDEILKLEDLELIEDCDSILSNPANLVAAKRKNSDRIRLCVDYRRLNEEIPDNYFPLPTKEELLAKLGNFDGRMVFIKLDVSNMFWNFPLRQEDRHYTAFYTEHGVKQWRRLPFGLKSATGIVQQALSKEIFSKNFKLHPTTTKSLFVDDNLYGVKDAETAIEDLDRILTLFGKLGLKIKLSKCDFLTKSVEFMGTNLKVSQKGVDVSANPENIQAIQALETPKKEKCLRGFIGMVNWITEFLPNIQLNLGPFYNLLSQVTKKKCKLSDLWTDSHEKLFKEMKNTVADPKTLSIPRYQDKFYIEVDSSGRGSGAVCYQDHGIIAYASKALPKHALNYENAHRETSGVVWAIDKFAKFFSCSPYPTTIYTDNRVTQFIKTAKSQKLRRWKSMIDSYGVVLEHRKGQDMKVSDALSRLVREPTTGDYIEDKSDQLLEEIVIASSIQASQLEAYQVHLRHGHCRADRLKALTGEPLELCKGIVDACFQCQIKKPVREQKQILGTIKDDMKKNSTWTIDLVYWKERKYLSILDRSTRFFVVSQVDCRAHAGLKKALAREFLRLGLPEKIVADREMVSGSLAEFFREKGIIFRPLTRESPFLNLVERYHQEVKKIALISEVYLEEAAGMLNYLPFTNIPAGMKARKISPALLFYENDCTLIQEVCKFLENESEKRHTRSQRLRGRNILRFQRTFVIGDLVKFNLKDGLGLGKVIAKEGTKMYQVKRIDGSNLIHAIHAQQLEKLLLPETFIKKMLY